MNIVKELQDLLKKCDTVDPNELGAIHMRFMILDKLQNLESSKSYNSSLNECVYVNEPVYSDSCNYKERSDFDTTNVNEGSPCLPKLYTEMDLVAFGNFVLSKRESKLINLNERFIESVQDINNNFFFVDDSDVCYFRDSQLND